MSAPVASRVPISNALRCFRRNRRGSAAIEFALVAPVFFALLFAIIETATMFFASQVLETITQDSARLIQTGRAQQASPPFTQAQFQAYVCSQIPALFDCNKVYVDVESYSYQAGGFSNVVINSQIDASGNFINNMKYCPGNEGDIVVVRLCYQWPLFVTGLGYNISNLAGNQRLLAATAAFRNEPFPNAPPSAC